jgi:hypothetical protein
LLAERQAIRRYPIPSSNAYAIPKSSALHVTGRTKRQNHERN